jgi:hypothetical protein
MAMDAILATIANGGRAIVDINREARRNKLISHFLYYLILNPLTATLAKPFRRGSCWGWSMFSIKTMPLERQTTPSWWGCLCAVGFASQKPSKQECLFPPERT